MSVWSFIHLLNTTLFCKWEPLSRLQPIPKKVMKHVREAGYRQLVMLHENYLHVFRSSYYFLNNFFLQENPFDFVILPLLA